MLIETTHVTTVIPVAFRSRPDSLASPAETMDGDPALTEMGQPMAHETGWLCHAPDRTGGSLADLVELLAAMKEAGWVKDAPALSGESLAASRRSPRPQPTRAEIANDS